MRPPLLPALLGVPVLGSASAFAAETELVVEAADWPAGAAVVPLEGPAADELADALDRVPGLQVRRLGGLGAWAGVSLRGQGFRQTQVHLDGVPLNPDGVDAVNLAELPLAALDSAWVFRGRPPATYGASSPGGLVDLRSAPGPARPRLVASAGSFGSVRTAAAGGVAGRLGGTPTDASLAVDVLGTRGDFPYLDDGGTRFVASDDSTRAREANDRVQVAAHGRWRVADSFTLLDAFVHRDEALPGPIGLPASDARLVTTRNLAVVQGAGAVGGGRLTGRAWGLVRVEQLDDRAGQIGVGRQWQVDTFPTVGAQLEGTGDVTRWLELAGSASARWEAFGRDDRLAGIADPWRHRAVAGAALEASFRAPFVIVTPALDVRLVGPVEVGEDVLVVPNPGLAVALHGLPVRLRIAGGGVFRPPDLTERYGDRGALVGNPGLRPERGWTGDVGLGWTAPDAGPWVVEVEAGGFVTALDDRITWVQNAQRTVIPVNLGATRVGGAELGARAAFGRWVEATTALTVLDARATDAADPATLGSRLPFVPTVQLDQQLAVAWPDRVRLAWTLAAQDPVTTDAAGLGVQPARWIHGLALRVDLARGAPYVEVEVRNVGDQRTGPVPRDPLAGDDVAVAAPIVDLFGYPLPGRTLWVTLAWRPEVR